VSCFFVSVYGFVYMEKSTACLVSAIVILCCFCCINYVTSDASDHRYKEGDFVPFYANKVGPFHNPRLDFQYFHFFFYPFKIYFDLNVPQIIIFIIKKNLGCFIMRLRLLFKKSSMKRGDECFLLVHVWIYDEFSNIMMINSRDFNKNYILEFQRKL
jgi:hypothetical protein